MAQFTIYSTRVVLPDGIEPARVVVRDGAIAAIEPYSQGSAGADDLDVGDRVLLPGLVDPHVHINDPGRAAWEGFEHATQAAAAGGVTTLVDMPLNSIPPATTAQNLEAKRKAASGRCHVDVAFWGGVVPGNADDIEPLVRAGVLGFKCFLCPSGVDEFGHVSEPDLRDALGVLSAQDVPLLAHAELPGLLRDPAASRDGSSPDPRRYDTWLASRPAESEHAAIDLLVRLARQYHARVHIVHLASAEALPTIRAARRSGVALTVETCPHYLTFSADEIEDGATAFKCAPPIRSRRNRDDLWTGLVDADIDFIATDHSPAPPALKHFDDGDFVRAWGGIASLQLGLAAVWSGAHARGVSIDRVARWMAQAPAAFAGLPRKGAIKIGNDADFVVWDPDAEAVVDPAALYHRHKATPYAGRRLRGRVLKTILRGTTIYEDGRVLLPPAGALIRR
jgi:allantoinase